MNCGWMQTVLAVIILVFVIWPSQIFAASVSQVIVIIAAALLLIHALGCKKCCGVCGGSCSVEMDKTEKPKKKAKKKKK